MMVRTGSLASWMALGAGLAAGLLAGEARGQSDSCAGATTLPLGNLTVDLAVKTPDGGDACRNGVDDVWYLFTAPRDGVLKLSACGNSGRTPVFSVHLGCPGTAANMIGRAS